MTDADAAAQASILVRLAEVPELLLQVLRYLDVERVDLLPLAAVSKTLRAFVLPFWAQRLDLLVSTAPRRLQFFCAHPDLLRRIRFLRVRTNGKVKTGDSRYLSDEKVSKAVWDDLNSLLQRIAAATTPASPWPLLDLIVDTVDAIDIPQPLKRRVVALQAAHWRWYGPNESQPYDYSARNQDEEATALASPRSPGVATTMMPRFSSQLAEVLRLAGEGIGIRRLQLGDIDLPNWHSVVTALLGSQAQFIRTLELPSSMEFHDDVIDRILSGTFPNLRHFLISGADFDSLKALEGFVDRHSALQSLSVSINFVELKLQHQNFPNLRWLYTNEWELSEAFAARHRQIVVNHEYNADPLTASLLFQNLRYLEPRFARPLAETLSHGIRISHLSIDCSYHSWDYDYDGFENSELAFFRVLQESSDAAQHITCLDIHSQRNILNHEHWTTFQPLGAANFLPNLTELIVSSKPWAPEGEAAETRRRLGVLFKHLLPLRRLRILHIDDTFSTLTDDGAHAFLEAHVEVPPALEYVVWARFRDHYRFVSSDPYNQVMPGPNGGKMGWLQHIPDAFRTRITPDGVWEPLSRTIGRPTILNHLGPAFD